VLGLEQKNTIPWIPSSIHNYAARLRLKFAYNSTMPPRHKRRRSFLATRDETCPRCMAIIPWHQVRRVDYDYSICPRGGRVYSIEED
jgi:hypothetical protein